MNKYLMIGAAALALGGASLTSCSNEKDLYDPTANAQKFLSDYAEAFYKVFGTPDQNQDWGFGDGTTRAGIDVNDQDVAATHDYHNMNANEWADPTPGKEFGGWIVPDSLTEGQKARVRAYFQANPNLTYQDPHWRHFFVQQTYKGGDAVGANSTEALVTSDNNTYTSDNMNLLSVGQENIHINNFNGGSYSGSSLNNYEGAINQNGSVNVLDSGYTANEFAQHHHADQITFMVNVDDTSCFGYHNSGANVQKNNKAALVDAAVIDAWAELKKDSLQAINAYGEKVVDKWNRSFLGFDLAIREVEEVALEDWNNPGNPYYAVYSQAPESPLVAWDGEKVIEIASGYDSETWATLFNEGYEYIRKSDGTAIPFVDTNQNFYTAAKKVVLYQTTQAQGAVRDSCVVLKDIEGHQAVINLPLLRSLADQGYLPVYNTSLTQWVQVGSGDGYFSDWIVTLTKAERLPQNTTPGGGGEVRDASYDVCIIAEDLSASEKSDFDFNDVVFNVTYDNETTAKVQLLAAGGTLPLTVAGREVHAEFGYPNIDPATGKLHMINTGVDVLGATAQPFTVTGLNRALKGKDIVIKVKKGNTGDDSVDWIELTANKGEAAAKIAVTQGFEYCKEFQDINGKYPLFNDWVQDKSVVWYSNVEWNYSE